VRIMIQAIAGYGDRCIASPPVLEKDLRHMTVAGVLACNDDVRSHRSQLRHSAGLAPASTILP
jgi:hypothetical protein